MPAFSHCPRMRFQSMMPLPTSVMSLSESPKSWPPAAEIGQGIRTGDCDPAQVQLHFHQVRITLLQQHVVGQLSVYREELEPVIVIGELNAGFLADFSGMIEGIDGTFPTVGLLTQLFRYPRAHDVT